MANYLLITCLDGRCPAGDADDADDALDADEVEDVEVVTMGLARLILAGVLPDSSAARSMEMAG